MAAGALPTTVALAVAAALLVSCGGSVSQSTESAPQPAQRPASSSPRAPSAPPSVRDAVETKTSRVTVSDGRPRRARLSIPALGLHDLAVVPYRGRTDDAPGTRIQDRGVAASPYGPRGGVGPGRARQLPDHRPPDLLDRSPSGCCRRSGVGQRAVVTADGVRYVYEIRRPGRRPSARPGHSPSSVPPCPAVRVRRPRGRSSRCRRARRRRTTPRATTGPTSLHNPEHRIDKIGVLVRTVSI